MWLIAFLAGALLGLFAQFLRQIPLALMYLGGSAAPWITAGFLLSVSASRGVPTTRDAISVAAGTVATYLVAWLVSYHLLFVLRESVSMAVGWRQAAPWLVVSIPASLSLGAIAALSHKHGILGDVCLAVPIAWSLPEFIGGLKQGWLAGTAIVVPAAVFAVLLIHMIVKERQVNMIVLLVAVITLGSLGLALFPVFWFLLLGRY
jgi:hypothetical protein